MPAISRFFGITISMYFRDHGPPHFHARYAEFEASFAIEDLRALEGQLPRRASALVREWAAQHREALEADWALAQQMLPLRAIPPLE